MSGIALNVSADSSFLLQVVSYGISINLVEVTWKSKIKMQFPNPNDYSAFMGDFSSSTGAVTFVMMLLSRVIFRKFGWGVAALITPSVILLTGQLFCNSIADHYSNTDVISAGLAWTSEPICSHTLAEGLSNCYFF